MSFMLRSSHVLLDSIPRLPVVRSQQILSREAVISLQSRSKKFPPPAVRLHLARRDFHAGSKHRLREVFPVHGSNRIKATLPSWKHPVYTEQQIQSVRVAHRNAKTWSDYLALSMVRLLRFSFDRISGYRHGKDSSGQEFRMSEKKYLIRNIFLESIAGVPGMAAGMVRHMRSLGRLQRDHGWMESLLEESYNERMHLITFLKMAEPGRFMHLAVLMAQSVFFPAFLLCYLVLPKTCHRFVGYLEEEAIITYTREIEDIDAGKLPGWANASAPDFAIKYWNMPEGRQSVRDLLLYIRADEAKHREVNHTLGNLEQTTDPNPFTSEYKPEVGKHPKDNGPSERPNGWERDEVI